MTSDRASLASRLMSDLQLDFAPVAFTRVSAPPMGMEVANDAVPSACAFWRKAEQGVFFADDQAHMGCPIGAMVMGFKLSDTKTDELMSLVGDMCAVAYLEKEEVERIPRFDAAASGAVYGPLAEFPLDPDVVLVWATPRQAMLLEETLGATQWLGDGGSVLGRPACAALPSAVAGGSATLSLGCAGMRIFTEIPDQYTLISIPKAQLNDLDDTLVTTLEANARMTATYKEMKAAV